MIDRIIKIIKAIPEFLKNRTALSIFLAWQIFVAKTVRTKPHLLFACVLVFVFGIIGIHTGTCPVKYTLTCIYAKFNAG